MYFSKKTRRKVIFLNVVALIDISALIIIFLMLGSVFGESSVAVPFGMVIPKSISKETVENAPSVTITENEVKTSFAPEAVPLALFHDNGEKLANFKAQLSKFVNSIPAADKQSGVLLNVIADRKSPYRDIFDVIRVFRGAGFQSVLFIAQGK